MAKVKAITMEQREGASPRRAYWLVEARLFNVLTGRFTRWRICAIGSTRLNAKREAERQLPGDRADFRYTQYRRVEKTT